MPDKPKHPGGRPSTYSVELATDILVRISEGESVRTICADDKMPAMSTIFKWLNEHKEFSEQYARAKQEAADAMAEDMLAIADAARSDRDAVAKAKLQVETRQWIASKLKPKKYGDKLDMTTNGKDLPTPIMRLEPDDKESK